MPTAFQVCPGCAVVWDKAETEGRLIIAFTTTGLREWKGPAYCQSTAPTRRAHMSYYANGSPKDLRLQVFKRTESAPVLR